MAMRLSWLPEVLRAAGLTVHEVTGWKTRGSASWGPIRGITIHETRGSRTSSDAGEIGVLVDGRPGLPGPIAQLYLSRTGAWHVVASGRANHNKTGWAGPNKGYGNSRLLGVEAQHAAGEPWTDRQYDSYVRGVAALVRKLGIPVSRVAGHYEHQPGEKTDPAFDMTRFRADVAQAMEGDMPLADSDIQKIKAAILGDGGVKQLLYRVEALVAMRDPIALPGSRVEGNMLANQLAALPEQTAQATMRALGGQSPDEAAQALLAALGRDRAVALAEALTTAARQG